MAKYLAKMAGFIGDTYREPGEVFDYEGKKPGKWMMLLEEEKPAVKEEVSHVKTPLAKEVKAKAKAPRASDQSVI